MPGVNVDRAVVPLPHPSDAYGDTVAQSWITFCFDCDVRGDARVITALNGDTAIWRARNWMHLHDFVQPGHADLFIMRGNRVTGELVKATPPQLRDPVARRAILGEVAGAKEPQLTVIRLPEGIVIEMIAPKHPEPGAATIGT